MEKIKKTYRISSSMQEEIEEMQKRTGKSQVELIEAAWNLFYHNQEGDMEVVADLFLKKFEEKYYSWLVGVRLGTRMSDVNSQIIIEILNSMLINQGEKRYIPTYQSISPVLSGSTNYVKDRIKKAKQKSDEKKAKEK